MKRLEAQLVAALRARLEGRESPVPEAGGWLWDAFAALHRARSGPGPIAYGEIAAWAGLTGWPIGSHHVEVLAAMDAAWLAWAREQRKRAAGAKEGTLPPTSSSPLSPALFDVMMR